MSKPSILLINRVYPPERGATGRMMQDLSRVLHENGWRVTVLSTTSKKRETPPQGINYQTIQTKVKAKGALSYSWIWFTLFFKALRLPKHDMVVTMTDPPTIFM